VTYCGPSDWGISKLCLDNGRWKKKTRDKTRITAVQIKFMRSRAKYI
jgi:hypothetical protein